MSEIISAWVDGDEMRRLAESLLSQPGSTWGHRFEVDFGSAFEGFTNPKGEDSSASSERSSEVVTSHRSPAKSQVQAAPAPPSSEEHSNQEEELGREKPTDSVPAGQRAGVNILKKAQVEGMAGGVIRSAKLTALETPSTPSGTSPGKSLLTSPFRRVSDPERGVSSSPMPTPRKLVRPPAPSGDHPILTRVHHYGVWLKGSVGVTKFFISNLEGKILIDEVKNAKLIQVARSLTTASTNNSGDEGQIGSLHVRIGESSILQVVPTPSQFGTLILGLILKQSLSEESVHQVRLGLQETADARLIRSQASSKSRAPQQ